MNYTTPVGTRHQAPRAATRKAHETHREEKERFSGSEKNLKPSHSGEHSPVPRGAHHANRHETLWTRRKKGEPEDVPNCLTFSNRLTRLRPSHVPRKRRVDAPPSSLRRRNGTPEAQSTRLGIIPHALRNTFYAMETKDHETTTDDLLQRRAALLPVRVRAADEDGGHVAAGGRGGGHGCGHAGVRRRAGGRAVLSVAGGQVVPQRHGRDR